MRKTLGLAMLAAAFAYGGANAQQVNVKIGVLSDMSSLYSDIAGQGSVVAAQMAVEDFGGKVNESGPPRELVLAVIFVAVATVMAFVGEGVARTFTKFEPLEAYKLDLIRSRSRRMGLNTNAYSAAMARSLVVSASSTVPSSLTATP